MIGIGSTLIKVNKIKVKLTIPGAPANADLSQYYDSNYLPDDILFYINTNIDSPDYWFVFEDLDTELVKCKINPKNIYFLGAETSHEKDYYKNPTLDKFLLQFEKIFTPFETSHEEIKTFPFLPWMINSNHGNSIFQPHERNFEYFKNLKKIEKTKLLSVICSSKSVTPGQKKRLEFVKKINNYFGEDIDWFGNGINQINTKWEGIKSYKYHLVIENNNSDYVISEKLMDAYLGLSFPIYYGGKMVDRVFPNNSYLKIDINNYEESKNKIKNLIYGNTYESNQGNLLKSKDIVLNNLNYINRIYEIIQTNPVEKNKKQVIIKSIGSIQKKQKQIYRCKEKLKKFIT